MDLKKFLDTALERGEKIKSQMLDEVIESPFVQQILKNERVINGMISLLTAKDQIERKVHKQIHSFFKRLEIPTREDYTHIEHKLRHLENELEELQRREMASQMKGTKAAPRKKRS